MSTRVSFADNITRKLLATLARDLPDATDARFAVAFVSSAGLSLIEPHLRQCLAGSGQAEFLVGLDLLTTEPEALAKLHAMSQAGLPVACFCYSEPSISRTSIYHPKLYLITGRERSTIVVGSSNLTRGGLRDNVEANAVVEADPNTEILSDVRAVYNVLKFQQPRVEPDAEFITLYEALHDRIKGSSQQVLRDAQGKKLMRQFADKMRSLRRPKPGPSDLLGWQKIVFERIPDGSFRTGDMYAFEGEFQRFYPENRNIRPKVRQVLQQLRDLGLIEHLATDRWERKR